MAPRTCPECRRRFDRRNQSHECAPAMTPDDVDEVRAWLTEAYLESPE